MFPEKPIILGVSNRNGNVSDAADVIRPIYHGVMREAITKVVNEEIKTAFQNHKCTGKTLEQEREEWEQKGKPIEQVFIVK